jgi:hypothetical protein
MTTMGVPADHTHTKKQVTAGMRGPFRLREEMIKPTVLGTEDMERLNMS